LGFRLYRTVSLGKGIRLYATKTGVGVSVGPRGLKYHVHSSGRHGYSAGLPGTGMYYRQDRRSWRSNATKSGGGGVAPANAAPSGPGPSAPRVDRLFFDGVLAYSQGDLKTAEVKLKEGIAQDPAGLHPSLRYLLAFLYLANDDLDQAQPLLEKVLASERPVPDDLMERYGVEGHTQVQVLPTLEAQVPHGSLSAALALAEIYQRQDRAHDAVELLDTVGYYVPDPLIALSAADLYVSTQEWDEVVRVTDDLPVSDEATAWVRVLRCQALGEEKRFDDVIGEIGPDDWYLGYSDDLRRVSRYLRASALAETGSKSAAIDEFQRLISRDGEFLDATQKLTSLRSESGATNVASPPPRPD
jgi:tetratricopeptide (TPR) repeat protein